MGASLPCFALDEQVSPSVELDGLTALYHRRSGMTHLVLEPVPAILDALRAGPCDRDEVERRLMANFDLADDEAGSRAQLLDARLDELHVLGLVRRLPQA